MNIILSTSIIFTLALVQWGQAREPCQTTSDNNAYNTFVKRHILDKSFDRKSKDAWKRYLKKKQLCGREKVQSFIEAHEKHVKQICSNLGRRPDGDENDYGNLCISSKTMKIYDVRSTETKKDCKIKSVNSDTHYVIVGCNKVKNKCLPVHYEKYNEEKPSNISCINA